MTNEGILVKLYSLLLETTMERAGALEEENLGIEKEREERDGWSRRVGTQLWLGQQKKRKTRSWERVPFHQKNA